MIFLPHGVFPGEVVDPEVLAKEFQEAGLLIQDTTQFQWKAGTFARDKFEEGHLTAVSIHNVSAYLNCSNAPASDVVLPDTAGADTDLWKVPYNRGFVPIGTDHVSGVSRIQWTQTYTGIAIATFSFQYVRTKLATFGWSQTPGTYVRLQVRLTLDGGCLTGTGPFSHLLQRKWAGCGYAPMTMAGTASAVAMLTTGPHEITAEAALIPITASTYGANGETGDEAAEAPPTVDPPTQHVCIGNRQLAVIRFGRGAPLSG